MQSGKISEELRAYVAQADEAADIPVLVSTKEIVNDTAAFDQHGLRVKCNTASIPLLSGIIKAKDLEGLSNMVEVVKVELDSEITLDLI
ncbi:hypothetical protein PZB74_14665 [Porifericola rhodea]|uniref:hypothetical protein n=1 Tax=Porifericola rhodea TaxID=930972 RepID=UPI002665326F|nr:hypothetical protein [Porifericola rhodea]WKN30206.1 hypothetical protein PZB74_14665 [Porifericola rhodea]